MGETGSDQDQRHRDDDADEKNKMWAALAVYVLLIAYRMRCTRVDGSVVMSEGVYPFCRLSVWMACCWSRGGIQPGTKPIGQSECHGLVCGMTAKQTELSLRI